MYQAIHTDEGKLLTPAAQYLDRHDVVYKRPSLSGSDGLPLGSGRMGGLLYHTDRSLELSLNHTDAWDFGPDGPMKAWAWEAEEKNTAPLSCGMISIRSSMPVFDWMYLEEYEEKLRLGSAAVEGHARTPFSGLDWKVFASRDPEVLVFQIDAVWKEETELEIRMERWPSPNFFHHYEQVVRIYDKNLHIVRAEEAEGKAILIQEAGKCRIAAAAYVDGEARLERMHSHGLRYVLPAAKEHHFTLYVSAAVREGGDTQTAEAGAAEKALSCLEAAVQDNALWEKHKKRWEEFWDRSFLHLPGEEYLENLYYIYLYQLGSSSLGKYPLTFAGLWAWNKDVRNWGHFYHWNHQQTYWCAAAAGHPELEENYLEYRYRMLGQAEADGKRLFGVKGAFYSDVSNMNGYNAPEPDTLRNMTVGAQIAMDFWRHFQYTKDTGFLLERTVPVMTSCARFLCGMLTEEDGVFVIKGGSAAYESYWNLHKSLTDYAQIRALFDALENLAELAELPEGLLEECREKNKRLFRPLTEKMLHEGKKLEIYSVGEKWDGSAVYYGEGDYPYSPFPAALLSMVYPAGITGLEKAGTAEFTFARNTARVLFDREIYQLGKIGCSGHTPAPQAAARLGMAEDVWRILRKFAETYQVFPNGLMHFADISASQQWDRINCPRVLEQGLTDTVWEEVHEKDKGVRTRLPSCWFLHCYFEAAANLAAGIQEALLQEREGVLYLFPGIRPGQPALFTLWAPGGFAVTAEKNEERIQYIVIKSHQNAECRIRNPWPGQAVCMKERTGSSRMEGECFIFPAKQGEKYLLYPCEFPPEQYYQCGLSYEANQRTKRLGKASIGLEKYY